MKRIGRSDPLWWHCPSKQIKASKMFALNVSLLWYCFTIFVCVAGVRSEVGGNFQYLIPSWMMIVG